MGYCLVSCVFVLLLFLQAVSGVVCSELRDFRKLWSSKSAVSGAHMLRYLQGIYIFISSLFLLPHSHMMIFFHLPTWCRMHLEVDRLMQNSLVIYRAVGVVAWVSFSLLALSLPSTLLSFPFTRCNYPSSFNNNEPTSSFIFLLLTWAQNVLFVNCICSLCFTPRVGFHSIWPLSFAVLLSFAAQNH